MENVSAIKGTSTKTLYVSVLLLAFLVGASAGYMLLSREAPERKNDVKAVQDDAENIKKAKTIVDEEIQIAKAAAKYIELTQKTPPDIGILNATGLLPNTFPDYRIMLVSTQAGTSLKVSRDNVNDKICNIINREIAHATGYGPGRTTAADEDEFPIQCNDTDQMMTNNNNVVYLVVDNAQDIDTAEKDSQIQPRDRSDNPYPDQQ